jgi:hypothetical protein
LSEDDGIALESVKILTDEVETKTFMDFDRYSETIIRLIKGSTPNFSIGIYGEWGTGKTTMMKSIEQRLKSEKDILTVWFNAWRYEREEQFALVSLMKTIAYKMDEYPKYEKVKQVLLKSVVSAGKGLLAKYVFSEKYVDELRQNLDSDMKVVGEIEKNTIYYHGLKQIEDVIDKIIQDSPASRVVVFVDDLDRCSPKKALEVFESIKVFLGISGFIYIIGLSHETIGKLITAEYEKSGITGEAYIKKIIQIPVMVPEWNTFDIGNFIEEVLLGKLDKRYRKIISDNKDLIAIASEANPREVKRFINNFIVSNEIFSVNPEVHPKQLLAIQALKVRWRNFYREITADDSEFRKAVEEIASMKRPDRRNKLREIKSRQDDPKNANREFEKRLIDIEPGLWGFLSNSKEIIFSIKNWDIYRRAAEAVKEIPHVESSTPKPTTPSWVPRTIYTKSDRSKLELLREGRVADFNLLQNQTGSKPLILPGVDLRGARLSGVNLRGAQFLDANLAGIVLDKADLSYSVLKGAKISSASLVEANLDHADLGYADFTNSDLTRSKLYEAYFQDANLHGAALFDVDVGHMDEFSLSLNLGVALNLDNAKMSEDLKRRLKEGSEARKKLSEWEENEHVEPE